MEHIMIWGLMCLIGGAAVGAGVIMGLIALAHGFDVLVRRLSPVSDRFLAIPPETDRPQPMRPSSTIPRNVDYLGDDPGY